MSNIKEYITYHDNGNVCTNGYLKDGKYHGICKSYLHNGTCSSIVEYNCGVECGVYNLFYENGSPYVIGTCVDGEYHGEHKMFYKNGNLLYHEHYLYGEEHGESRSYHNNGVLRYRGFVQHDISIGELIEYDYDGEITSHVFYEGGKEVPLSKYVQDINNITPEEEVTLTLVFGNNYFRTRK